MRQEVGVLREEREWEKEKKRMASRHKHVDRIFW